MVLVETGWAGVDWIGLTQDRDKWWDEEWCLLKTSNLTSGEILWTREWTKKNCVVWDVTPCGSCKELSFSETSVLTRATRLNVLEDANLHSHRRENLHKMLEIYRVAAELVASPAAFSSKDLV
jgi:hypothetical protein